MLNSVTKQEFKNVKQYKYMYLGKYEDCRFVSSLLHNQTFKMLIMLHICFILCVKFEQTFHLCKYKWNLFIWI